MKSQRKSDVGTTAHGIAIKDFWFASENADQTTTPAVATAVPARTARSATGTLCHIARTA
ncbi:hypothetical protein D3C83_169490 [compost metagenome]